MVGTYVGASRAQITYPDPSIDQPNYLRIFPDISYFLRGLL